MIQKLRLCWFILTRVPGCGMAELIEFAHEVNEFYRMREKLSTLPLPIIRKTKVNPGKTYIRPTFPIVEEDDCNF